MRLYRYSEGGVINDNSIDLVITDPPYKFKWNGRWIAGTKQYLRDWMNKIWTNADTDIYSSWELIENLIKLCKKPNIVLFCNKAQLKDILDIAYKYDLRFDILVLCKTAPTPLCNNQWLPDKERAVHLYKWIPVRWSYKTKRTFRVKPNFKDKRYNHPTVKPLDIIEDIIMNCSNEWDTVLDCYLWSWTTAVACKELNRNYIGIEINPEYVELAEQRLKEVDRLKQQTLF